MQQVADMMNRLLSKEQRADKTVQQMMEIMASESFQQQVEQLDPETPNEILQLLAQHGLTEAASIDLDKIVAEQQKYLETAYNARNPGKAPASEDDAMADRFAESMKQHGPIRGMTQFMRNSENAAWIGFRFKDDPEAYTAWKNQVRRRFEKGGISRATSESGDLTRQGLAKTVVEPTTTLQQDIPIGENAVRDPLVELEDSTTPDSPSREVTVPAVEPEKVVTKVSPSTPALSTDAELEASLKERFSSERFEGAMSTLERYGQEEGLRRLRENDPEVAKQIENSRRAGGERQRSREESEQ